MRRLILGLLVVIVLIAIVRGSRVTWKERRYQAE